MRAGERRSRIRRSRHWRLRTVQGKRAQPVARFLTLQDVDALCALEAEKWNEHQAASASELAKRIGAYPQLCIGAFCPQSGRLLASLFLRPICHELVLRGATWRECVESPVPIPTKALFGISLTSCALAGVDAMFLFFWPFALAEGWREVYLGAPLAGLRGWLREHPDGAVADYVALRRDGLPRDPVLLYYHEHGFRAVIGVKTGYFPHEQSLDFGVILKGVIPLSSFASLWQRLPLAAVRWIAGRLARLR